MYDTLLINFKVGTQNDRSVTRPETRPETPKGSMMHDVIELSSTPVKEEEIIELPSTPIYIGDSDEDDLSPEKPLVTGPGADRHITVSGSGSYTVRIFNQN
jgi:hypothetical protein